MEARDVIKYGKILGTYDMMTDYGFITARTIDYEGQAYLYLMLNGNLLGLLMLKETKGM